MDSTTRMIDRRKIVKAVFYVSCFVLVLTMCEFTHYINNAQYFTTVADDPAALSKAQDAYAAVNNLLITLTSGLLAGLGWYVTNRGKRTLGVGEFWPATLSAVFACVSLYWGYISSQNVQWAIENSIGSLELPKTQWPRMLQFYAMLISVFLFAEFLRRDLTEAD